MPACRGGTTKEDCVPLPFRPDQRSAGPWLDRLFPVHLPGGRMVSVSAFSLLPTNFGILEGGLDPVVNTIQREKIVELAERRHGAPVVQVEPRVESIAEISSSHRPRERLPWMACMARLVSKPLDPEMVQSELTLVWWQDELTLPLPEEIARAAAGLDWERWAVDWDLP
jgi:hypothetical protein